MTGPVRPAATMGTGAATRADQPRVFLSYRRRENTHLVGRLSERLVAAFGEANVFRDVESIPGAAEFVTVIKHHVRTADVVLAVIGPAWHDAPPQPDQDYVHLELRLALQLGKPVIPVLIEGATPPSARELPPELAGLAARNAMPIDADQHFRTDTDALIRAVRDLVRPPRPPAATALTAPPLPMVAPPRRRAGVVLAAAAVLLVAAGVVAALAVGRGERGRAAATTSAGTPTTAAAGGSPATTRSPATTPSPATFTATTTPITTRVPTSPCRLTVTYDFAEIRVEPRLGSLDAGRVPNGTYDVLAIAVTEFAGGDQRWYRIEASGATGWLLDSTIAIAAKEGACA